MEERVEWDRCVIGLRPVHSASKRDLVVWLEVKPVCYVV